MHARVRNAPRTWLAGLVVALTVLAARSAAAYPWYVLSSGSDRCNQCHVAPTGGGMLTPWGRSETGDTLARGGDGSFMNGLVTLPDWIDIGGDVRLAGLVDDTGSSDGAELAAFPMQVELGVHLAVGSVHVVASADVLDPIRTAPSAMTGISAPQTLPWLFSREHYVMWRPGDEGAYVRAGRFFAPFGLRLPDHTTYVRRYLGYDLFEEPYAVSAGYVTETWQLHAAAFISDPWRWAPRREVGGTLMYERTMGPLVLTASGRATRGDGQSRELGSLAAKVWFEHLSTMWLTEIDGGWQHLPGMGRAQAAAYLGPVWLPARGLAIGAAYEYYDEDLRAAGDTRQGADLWTSFMPYAHVELALSGRYQWIGPDARAAEAIFQLHYFL